MIFKNMRDFLILPNWFWAMLAAPFVGSLLGVLVRRLPRGERVGITRSACEMCKTPLGARHLVPLLSYVFLRGRCAYCGAPIGRFHPAMELGAIAVPIWSMTVYQGAAFGATCLLGWMLFALAVCDAQTFQLPDALTLPLLLCGLAVTYGFDPQVLTDHALATATGYLAFRGIAAFYRWLRGRDGLGQGDAKLLAAGGAWLGLAALPNVVLIAALSGLLLTALMGLRGRRLNAQMRLPFGPALALAIWLVWLYL
jgi:leader peptidase (prepilin peptidase)/N-methyltransferase